MNIDQSKKSAQRCKKKIVDVFKIYEISLEN